ncbi:protein ALWAYS EARLY 3 [Neltuma alba]|uniref:protein ALWAYS EARLY 3 n=1 Tax=Neltuma alba TaxID=207710 RepID=UPI0010A43B39|nr:protein ALWAYS EARLY 3-like [Prosopis alba]
MAPSRKSKSVTKRFSNIREAVSYEEKNRENVNKTRAQGSPGIQKKRKLADMLGPKWSKEELERFYDAYRKYGKDWKKVAAAVYHRSLEMVEALYSMNRAYLSLPEGTASVVGLIAMMTDHYSVLGGSDSGQETNEDTEKFKKPPKFSQQKCSYGNYKASDGDFSDHSQSHSITSGDGCLSLLKKRHSGLSSHAVRKRTPRVPVSHSIHKDMGRKCFSPARQGYRQMVDSNDVGHKIALALTEALQIGDTSKVSDSTNNKSKGIMSSPCQNNGRKNTKSEVAGSKFCHFDLNDGSPELSLRSTGCGSGDYSWKLSQQSSRGRARRGKNEEKGTKYYRKKLELGENENKHWDGVKEASSGTDEDKGLDLTKDKIEIKFAATKGTRSSFKSLRKKSEKVLLEKEDEGSFDALKALAGLSLMMPVANPDPESLVRVREENQGAVDESKVETHHTIVSDESTALGKLSLVSPGNEVFVPQEKGTFHLDARKRKRRQTPSILKNDETQTSSHLSGSQKIKRMISDNLAMRTKVQLPGMMSSSNEDKGRRDDSLLLPIEVSSTDKVGLANKGRHRRKMEKPKPMVEQDIKVPESIFSGQHRKPILQNSVSSHKEKLINCLSSHQIRRWCTFEWFYSAIDYPWFAKREFMEYLDHVGLGHVPRLSRVEWGVIRSSLGRPRRFSEQFLIEEKSKLNQYRDSVRAHYAELLAGTRDCLPTDLARPLIVGQRVIAIHPKTREIHDGSILTVDNCSCRVQFDQPELGVELVMDIDCMPLNPYENMPASLIRYNVIPAKLDGNLIEFHLNGKLKRGKIKEHRILYPSGNLDHVDALHITPSASGVNNLLKQGISSSSKLQANVACNEIGNARLSANSKASFHVNVPFKEAGTNAVFELIRALDKKEIVLSELKKMNDEACERRKYGDHSLNDSEPFKRHYAAVLLQLNEVNEQVSSALFCVRQHNTYQGNSNLSPRPLANSDDLGGQTSSSYCSASHNQNFQSHIAEIIGSSKRRARTMVGAAMQAMLSFTKTEDKGEGIEESINFINNRLSVDDQAALSSQFMPTDSVHVTLASQDQMTASKSKPLSNNHSQDPELNSSSDQNEVKIPSELISQCLATLLMIQKCTERHFPPADVVHMLDSAVTGLQPFCSKNLPIYEEIQKCMGIIRNQILALIPTQTT